jgi:hypothetical protein
VAFLLLKRRNRACLQCACCVLQFANARRCSGILLRNLVSVAYC